MAKNTNPADGTGPNNRLSVERSPDETVSVAVARKVLEPEMRHAVSAASFAGKVLGNEIEAPGLMDYITEMQAVTAKAESGDLAMASQLLAAQAVTLDSMFTELARRAANNMSEYIEASERYARLALKAQSNCRATLDSLAKLHQPREQTVRHVHVNEGGNAIVTDHFHNHTGGKENAKTAKQCQGTGTAGSSTPLLGQDTQGNGVPIASREGQAKVPHARRD